MEDEKIVDLYLQRDESAIRYTSEKYGKRLLYIANNILNDLSVSEECENDTYMEAWKAIPPYEPRTYLFAFLARITRHKALDICRKQSRSKVKIILYRTRNRLRDYLKEEGVLL